MAYQAVLDARADAEKSCDILKEALELRRLKKIAREAAAREELERQKDD